MIVNKVPSVALTSAIAKPVDVIVVGLASASGRDIFVGLPDVLSASFTKFFGTDLQAVVASLGASAKPGTTVLLPTAKGQRLIVTGLGDIDAPPEQIRRAAGNAARLAAGLPSDKPLTLAISFDTVAPLAVQAAIEGAVLGSYRFRADSSKPGIGAIQVVSPSRKGEARKAVDVGLAVAAAVIQTRDWVNQAPNLLYPESFADAIKEYGKIHKLNVEIWDEKALERDGFGGFLAVGGGSDRKPRLVKVTYAPRGAARHLILVGKGITFDSGGLDIKPPASMYTMKSDMSGAASVVTAIAAIAKLGLKVKVTAFACLAENMPAGSAYRPSDVLTMYNKKTVENANTDAEGRLVLADGLAKAVEERPDLIVDVATLTGACVIALGERVAGVMSRDDDTVDKVLDAAESAGELFWQLPIPAEARGKLDSKVADLKSTGDRAGGALSAAAFLAEFVPETLAWAHLDIAGTAFNEHPPYDYVPEGATGMPVRTLISLARSLVG